MIPAPEMIDARLIRAFYRVVLAREDKARDYKERMQQETHWDDDPRPELTPEQVYDVASANAHYNQASGLIYEMRCVFGQKWLEEQAK